MFAEDITFNMPNKSVKDMEEVIKKTNETVCHACIFTDIKVNDDHKPFFN